MKRLSLAAPAIVAAIVGLSSLLPAASIGRQPSTASVGMTFAETAQTCSGLFIQTTNGPHAETGYRIPFGGEIVSWSYQAVSPDVIKLAVARPLGPTGPSIGTAQFRMVGESARETMKPHRLNRFALARPIRVKRGDLIGLLAAGLADHCSRPAPRKHQLRPFRWRCSPRLNFPRDPQRLQPTRYPSDRRSSRSQALTPNSWRPARLLRRATSG